MKNKKIRKCPGCNGAKKDCHLCWGTGKICGFCFMPGYWSIDCLRKWFKEYHEKKRSNNSYY
jgi:hypothetical protein